MKFKAVLFDLDGTLLDTLEDLADSMNSALEQKGFPPHPLEDYKIFIGEGTAKLVENALPKDHRQPETVAEVLPLMQKEYSHRWDNKTKPYEGITELLDKLSALRLKKAVLSNKPHKYTKKLMDKLLHRWDFEIIWGLKDEFPPKPDPTSALEISKILEIPADQFIYLGDTNTDMVTAKAAGMYAVGALWGFRQAQELLDHGADALIEHPIELLKL